MWDADSAEASTAPDETNIEDNVFLFDITISIPGDINADGTVNILDLAQAPLACGKKPEDNRWDSNADVNEDQTINILDFSFIAMEFGKTV